MADSTSVCPVCGRGAARDRSLPYAVTTVSCAHCGAFRVVKPGLSEFKVREIKLRDFKVPTGAIPRLLQQINKGKRPEGIAEDALPVTTPKSLGDVRIANRQVTLYKTTPEKNP